MGMHNYIIKSGCPRLVTPLLEFDMFTRDPVVRVSTFDICQELGLHFAHELVQKLNNFFFLACHELAFL